MTTPGGERSPDHHAPFRRVLAVCSVDDGDRETLHAALNLADAWGAEVRVLTIAEMPGEMDRLGTMLGVSREEGEARVSAAYRRHLDTLIADEVPHRNLVADVRVGKRFLEIVRHVLAHDIDIVVKRAEDLGGIGRHLFASTDQHLLRKCPCPVWLRRTAPPQRIHDDVRVSRAILAAVDVDEAVASEPQTLHALNERIIETASAMGAADGATVHVLHVWDAPSEGLIRLWSWEGEDHGAARRYVREVESAHRLALDRLVEQARNRFGTARGIKFVPDLCRGVAREMIPEEVISRRIDLLVMGTIARTGVPGFIIGNTAEDILNCVDCSVVTVKPPGYISPVASHPNL